MLSDIIFLVAGLTAGALAAAFARHRRPPAPGPVPQSRPAPVRLAPAPAQPAPAPVRSAPAPVRSALARDEQPAGLAARHVQVAQAVLDVADSVTSIELCRRLAAAVRPLDGLVMIEPPVGTPFDPDQHLWDSSASATAENPAETVALTKVAGIATADGAVQRKARVVVFD
jgi:hypothetical protein